MKKFLILLFSFLLILSFTGCNTDKTASEKTPVKINLPSDNTVNGYKNNSNTTNNDITTQEIVTDKITVNQSTSNKSSANETNQNCSYGGNKNTKKFHKTSCYSFKKTNDENKTFLDTRDDFIAQGYSPCKICNP